jgi:5-methylthioadenosine/S-adenosylhomocysteine deaminase
MGILIPDTLTVTMNPRHGTGVFSTLIEEGRIAKVTRSTLRPRSCDQVMGGPGKVLIPGLFNGHLHGDMALARGLGDGYTLFQQDQDSPVSAHTWFSAQLDREARRLSRLLQYVEALQGGVTWVCDVPFWWEGDDLTGPFRETGLRGAVVLDYRSDFLTGAMVDREQYMTAARRLAEQGIPAIVEAPAEEGFDPGLLTELSGRAWELDTLLHLHLAETTWRRDLVLKKFGTTPVRFLKDLGILDQRILGSHGVYLEDEEINLLRDAGSRIVNCPAAEMKISDGIAPAARLLRRGVPLCLGTDGALWNDSSDLFAEMKTLLLVQRVAGAPSDISPADCLQAATMGAARVFGCQDRLGSIEEGKSASLVLVDFIKPHLVPLYHGESSNLVNGLVTCARASDVHTVMVDGRVVVENSRLLTLDARRLVEQCQAAAEMRFRGLSL